VLGRHFGEDAKRRHVAVVESVARSRTDAHERAVAVALAYLDRHREARFTLRAGTHPHLRAVLHRLFAPIRRRRLVLPGIGIPAAREQCAIGGIRELEHGMAGAVVAGNERRFEAELGAQRTQGTAQELVQGHPSGAFILDQEIQDQDLARRVHSLSVYACAAG
jgi:hypothetical protein